MAAIGLILMTTSNDYDSIRREICNKVNNWHKEHPTDIANFLERWRAQPQDNQRELFQDLKDYREYLELYRLNEIRSTDYIDAKRHLKEIALISSNKICDEDKEKAFYEWLKICINPSKETSYDFYLEKEGLDKEKEVKEILFNAEEKGTLREIFRSEDWQIRLRTISDWFLRRYDIGTARKILREIKSPNKTIIDSIKIINPRLVGAIIIGFLPLVVGQDMWILPLKVGLCWAIGLSVVFLLASISYLTIECYNITRASIKESFWRALLIGCKGAVISLILSTVIVCIVGEHLVAEEYKMIGIDFFGGLMFPEIIPFFAFAAFFIGIFIQIFWEEKTITEPL